MAYKRLYTLGAVLICLAGFAGRGGAAVPLVQGELTITSHVEYVENQSYRIDGVFADRSVAGFVGTDIAVGDLVFTESILGDVDAWAVTNIVSAAAVAVSLDVQYRPSGGTNRSGMAAGVAAVCTLSTNDVGYPQQPSITGARVSWHMLNEIRNYALRRIPHYVTIDDTRQLDWTGADIRIADSSISNNPVTRHELDVFRESLTVTDFYYNTNAHPVIAGAGRMETEIPDACQLDTGALNAGTNILYTFWLTNTTARIRGGVYETICHVARLSGNSAAYMRFELLYSDDGGTNTNVVATATSGENITGAVKPYQVFKGLADDITNTDLYLGVRLSIVRASGGSGASLRFYGGVGYPSHLATPGIGDVSGYALSTDLDAVDLRVGAIESNYVVSVNSVTGTVQVVGRTNVSVTVDGTNIFIDATDTDASAWYTYEQSNRVFRIQYEYTNAVWIYGDEGTLPPEGGWYDVRHLYLPQTNLYDGKMSWIATNDYYIRFYNDLDQSWKGTPGWAIVTPPHGQHAFVITNDVPHPIGTWLQDASEGPDPTSVYTNAGATTNFYGLDSNGDFVVTMDGTDYVPLYTTDATYTDTVAKAASALQSGAAGTSTNLSDYNNDVPFLTNVAYGTSDSTAYRGDHGAAVSNKAASAIQTELDPVWGAVSNTVRAGAALGATSAQKAAYNVFTSSNYFNGRVGVGVVPSVNHVLYVNENYTASSVAYPRTMFLNGSYRADQGATAGSATPLRFTFSYTGKAGSNTTAASLGSLSGSFLYTTLSAVAPERQGSIDKLAGYVSAGAIQFNVTNDNYYHYVAQNITDSTGTNSGAIINQYGLYLADLTTADNNYGVYQVGSGVENYMQGDLDIGGTLSKGGGSFKIDHPVDPLNRNLVHSFVEAPRMELIYRDYVTLKGGVGQVSIDATYGMIPGTFEALTRNPQVQVWNNASWDRVRATITGDVIYVESEKPVDIVVEWMVIAQRDDPFVYNTSMCDEHGNVILEPLKPEMPDGLLDPVTREAGEHDDVDAGKSKTIREPVEVGMSGYRGHYMRPTHHGAEPLKRDVIIHRTKEATEEKEK